MRHRDERWHLGDQSDRRDVTVLRVIDVERVMVERGHRADEASHDRHRMRITTEATQEELHLLVHHRVVRHVVHKLILLFDVWQVAVKQQITGFEVVAVGRNLLDGITAIEELALVAINVCDGRAACRRRHKTGVIGELARLAVE